MLPIKDIWSAGALAKFEKYDGTKKFRYPPLNPRLLMKKMPTKSTLDKNKLEEFWIPVKSYSDLIMKISFLSSMNRRTNLYFRGQHQLWNPLPMMFRKQWKPFSSDDQAIRINCRVCYFNELAQLQQKVFLVLNKVGLVRHDTVRDIREALWAVCQHYALWPTPLLDVTTNIRTAASFALPEKAKCGYIFVFGMPPALGSVTCDGDQQILIAKLQSILPPAAIRAHIQDGFLIGRHPLYSLSSDDQNGTRARSNPLRRLIAVLYLEHKRDDFFSLDSHPAINERLLFRLTKNDPLEKALELEFGLGKPTDITALATKLAQKECSCQPAGRVQQAK